VLTGLRLSTFDMDRANHLFLPIQGADVAAAGADIPQSDTSETVYLSSLALLKILKHARAGVPMEVMGLLLGEFVDDWTINVVDYFAMPQSGTGVSVEAIDAVYQQQFLEALQQTGRHEVVCGWGHSHPGFGCWLSGVDVNTAQSFEALNARAVSLVVDPIQSVKGKVVADTFRTLNPQLAILGMEPRQTTSNAGSLNKPSIQALIHGLNRHYYSLRMEYKLNDLERKMLLNLNRPKWTRSLSSRDQDRQREHSETTLKDMVSLSKLYTDMVKEELRSRSKEELAVSRVGKLDAKRRLADGVKRLCDENCHQMLTMNLLKALVFPKAACLQSTASSS
jgi:26S proteasome regulatory subunit N11